MDYSFIIRRAVPEDAPAVYQILQKAFKEYAQAAGVKELEALNESISDVEHEIKTKLFILQLLTT